MKKKDILIEQINQMDSKYFNEDQKTIAINILRRCPDQEVQSCADFLFNKRKIGFAFDYSPEIAKGRIITLREDKKRRINVGDEIKQEENKLIIGDNYNALKSLLVTHKEKIDIIYIDPPYNTESAKSDGNNDSHKEGESSKFYYKDKFGRNGWLTMMKDRLTLAKDLLKDDGVIFVSIDDSEQAYLKVLMDEIFGEENFSNQLVWISNKKGRQISNKVYSKTYEYILLYSKDYKNLDGNLIDREYAQKLMPSMYEDKELTLKEDENGTFITQNELHNTNIKSFNINTRPNLFFPIWTNGKDISLTSKENYIKILPPKNSLNIQGVWRWSKNKVLQDFKDLEIVPYKSTYKIYTKIRELGYTPKDVIISSQITSKTGTSDLENLKINGFNFPKPKNLIKFILKTISSNKNAVILDFFAGSGTTGHAVMELNREDEGNRKFILVTNNENNIAHNVTYERFHRIIKGEGTKKEKDFIWLNNNKPYDNVNLRVVNVDDSVKISLDEENIDEKIFDECKNGLKLLDYEYNKKDLNLYYDLSALNPIEKIGE
ncbi:MAG: site-specific DNA-methyltransferase [Metamycoplasmataceae bacterium]